MGKLSPGQQAGPRGEVTREGEYRQAVACSLSGIGSWTQKKKNRVSLRYGRKCMPSCAVQARLATGDLTVGLI